MSDTILIPDIMEENSYDYAVNFAKIGNNIVFCGNISRLEATKLVRKLLKYGAKNVTFYQADLSKLEEFDKIKSFVIQNFGDYCLFQSIKGKVNGNNCDDGKY